MAVLGNRRDSVRVREGAMGEKDRNGKAALRERMKALRNDMPVSVWLRANAAMTERVCASEAYRQAECLLAYVSFDSEASTKAVISQALADGKTVALPRCAGPRALRWYRVEDLEGLESGAHGIPEPPADPEREVVPAQSALALVPGLAFDRRGYRLGYGGGYYDTFLATFPGRSIGLCFACQLVESLADEGAVEAHDIPVGAVITA